MTIYLSITIIFLTALGQIFLKKGALTSRNIFLNWYVLFGYTTFVAVVFLSLILMNHMPLKNFSIIISFNYPVTVLFAGLFLKEKISRNTWIACFIIFTGCIIFNL